MINDQSWKVRSNPEFDEFSKPSVIYSDCPEYQPITFEKGETSDLKGHGVGRSTKNKNDCLTFRETSVENSCTPACRLWVIDSGCSRHKTGFKHLLHNYVEEPAGAVRFANSEVEGHVRGYRMLDNGVMKIQRVLYVEGLDHNLFSTSHFCDMKYQVRFTTSHCYLEDPDGYEIFRAERHRNLYYIHFPTLSATRPVCLLAKASKAQS
ncbi:hypothetical protein L6452_38751 [Arctium lappa]|uniref:Uncharacterized protein n=1 Tax=Arctium lappa TaxID=4217 RepID=A0ACB8XQZ0_ARCLA|nr:hypothetical protein L6452_38751 [Arctium lappa]